MSEYAPELSPYTNQVQTANNHTERLVRGVAELALGLGGVRAVAGGAAADFQKMSSGMAASATVTHQSMTQLSGAVRQLSRDFPITTAAGMATVESIQSLGLTAKNQVPQVLALSRTMTQLAEATGSFGPELAQSFGQLTRQMASLDPKRVQSFADSLTTLHARSGASAQSISQFAQSIAPMAQAAGLGETSVLGIATSFAKVGQDGYVAANTVSKMMSDMSRSVRDGSNDMAGYANVVGMTANQFQKMFRSNPAEAITRVTEAIAKMPTGQGQRALEMLGIEGVRGQRALLSVAQSGGLRADIATAANAYGSGSTATAASAATKGVTDSLTRLETATTQVAEAFERPLLGAVSHIVNATAGFTRGVGGVVGSRPVQATLGLASELALPLIAARLAGRMLSTGALGSLLLRSGPVSGLLGGIGAGRAGSSEAALANGVRTRAARQMLEADVAGDALGATAMSARVNRSMFNFGAGMGAMFPAGGGGAGMFRMMRGAGVLGTSMLMRSQSEMFRLARMDPIQRDAYLMRPHETGTVGHYLQQRQSLQGDLAAGTIGRGQYLAGLRRELAQLVASSAEAGNAFRMLGGSMRELAVQAGRTAFAGARAAASGLASGAMNLLGGPVGMTMLAGTAIYGIHQRDQAENAKRDQRYSELDIFGTTNAYHDAMGKAGESAANLSTQMDAASQSISTAVSTITQATTVSSADVAAATHNKNVTQQYSGTTAQVAAQIAAVNTRGVSTSDLQGAKLDLIRLQQSGQLPASFDINTALGQASQVGNFGSQQISNIVQGMTGAKGLGDVGFGLTSIRRAHLPGEESLWEKLGHSHVGSPQLGKVAGSEMDLLVGAIGQRQVDMTTRFGQRYAAGQTLQSADQAMRAALRTHNADIVVGMEQELSNRLTGKTLTGVSASDIQKAGGFSQLLAQRGLRVNNQDVSSLLRTGAGPQARIEDSVAQTLLGSPATAAMGQFFSNFGTTRGIGTGQRALAAAANAPEDLEKQAKAVTAIVDSGTKAGMSLADLAAQAAHTTSTMADGDARRAVMIGVIAEATRRLQNELGGMTIGQRFGAQAQMASQLSQVTGNSPEAMAARQQGAQMAATTVQSEREYMQQRIMAQFQYELQSKRSYHDYYLAVSRANEDFQIGMARSEEDFQRQRYRSTRDFNIQIQREQEDAARTMYDPYTRIQAKPVYDAGNLMLNMNEQLAAMRRQVRNIHQLRDMGMSEQALRVLGAYDPANAQQVQELVFDLQQDRGMIAKFNSNAAQRQGAASALLSQDPTFQRQKEDFRRQLRDSAKDYQIARDRQIADFHRSMDRQATDFQTQMARMLEDLHNADRELTGDMTSLQKDMNKILHGQQVDWSNELKNNLRDTINTIHQWTPRLLAAQNNALHPGGGGGGGGSGVSATGGQSGGGYGNVSVGGSSGSDNTMAPGMHGTTSSGTAGTSYVNPGTGRVYQGSTSDNELPSASFRNAHPADIGFNKSIARSMEPEWAQKYWNDWQKLWDVESGWSQYAHNPADPNNYGQGAYGIPQAYPGRKLATGAGGKDWQTNPATQIRWGIDYIKRAYGNPHNVAVRQGLWTNHYKGYAAGGIATGPHIGVVAEAHKPEAMIPLDEHGVSFLARAFASYLAPHEAAAIGGGGGRAFAIHVEHHGNVVYDHSVQFPGAHIEVASDDPSDFARKAEAKTRRDNLTAARGVAWSRT